MKANAKTRQCPYCKEEIKAGAIKCKHCRAMLRPETPPHHGTCPYCKEAIKPDAIKCKHCGSMLGSSTGGGCEGCSQTTASLQALFGEGPFRSVETDDPSSSPLGNTSSIEAIRCSPCVYVTERNTGRGIGIKICCAKLCIPGFGCKDYCWVDTCFTSPDIIV